MNVNYKREYKITKTIKVNFNEDRYGIIRSIPTYTDLVENCIKKDHLEEIKELTRREKEILICISKGKTNHEIANDLYITEHTVKNHTSNIFEKLKLRYRTHTALYVH